ncbi:protein CIP2A homolog [Xenia sp. Carnegie-2017]|uniref:protein CIP2A homolog n=1 Tax=Xenia sp. Carnegie-2017 TaxID=2897299 RepID=UPI001F040D13|nr:protein CIP2A homolog [Xenia sp. Carnegie-2017]
MSLDINSCLKAFSVAFSQYNGSPNEQTLKYVERQMDVLIGITSKEKSLDGFTAGELLPTECLTSLVSMLNEVKHKPRLISKCLMLLYNLANDNETRIMLRDSYHLTSTLTGLLIGNNSVQSSHENIFLQCFQLLQRITYGCRYSVAMAHVEDLVKFLINEIQGGKSEMTMPALGILTNLCRNNIAVQAQVKALENIKYIYRCLVKFLSHHDLTVIVYALSLITSLALKEQLGEKLFNNRNIEQTFQLLFNILVNGDGALVRKYAVDLFVDLLPMDKIKRFLISYDHLTFYLDQSLNLLFDCEPDEAEKIFEFLLAICCVSDVRAMLYEVFENSESSCEEGKAYFDCVLRWINWKTDRTIVAVKALEFLKEMYEEGTLNSGSDVLMSRMETLLPNLVKNLETPADVEARGTRRTFEKVSRVLDVFSILCSEESVVKYVCDSIECSIFRLLVEQQYRLNDIAMKEKLTFTADWSEVGVSVALKTLDLMSQLIPFDKNIKETQSELIKDDRLLSFLAHTISEGQKDDVQVALRVLQQSCKTNDFHIAWLGDLIYCNNRMKQDELKVLRKRNDELNLSPLSQPRFDPSLTLLSAGDRKVSASRRNRNSPKTSTFINSVHDESTIESLIDKMKSGLEIKDTKASEIMDVYEAKLASLLTKESHLQDLLEAKSLALAQSDRMISQYRCRRAQSEAECTKLRQMLQETEKRCESQSDLINGYAESKRESTEQMEKFKSQIKNLQQTANAHDQLKITFAEESNRLKTVKEALVAAHKEHESLSELNEMLRRHNNNLKEQHDCSTRQLRQLEEERKNIMLQVQQKDIKINELTENVNTLAERVKNTSEDLVKTENSYEKCKTELVKKEHTIKELVHKVASLELVCSQNEKSIKEKEEQLREQQKRIDKYAQLSAMIHNMTGNDIPAAKFDEKPGRSMN